MTETLIYYFHVTQFYMEKGHSLAVALKKAKVPFRFHEQIGTLVQGRKTIKGGIVLPLRAPNPRLGLLCAQNKAPFDKKFMPNYLEALNAKGIPSGRIVGVANEIAGRLPFPTAQDSFGFKGLVVGHVQSGKTANMGAVICRAAEYGYNLIIIFSGIYNDLRKQTQERFEEDVIQVGSDFAEEWGLLTTPEMGGDFRPTSIRSLDKSVVNVAVVKKRVTTLKQIHRWISSLSPKKKEHLKVLIIDDEADQASIDTNFEKRKMDKDINPAQTNRWIRQLLGLLPRKAYLGFTATPFANVFIDVRDKDDLYPRDLIFVLDEPENYFGATSLFGFEKGKIKDLDVVREITAIEAHSLRNAVPALAIPDILKKAILSFFIATAIRRIRGQKDHSTMLVHVSHRKADHEEIRKIVEKYVNLLKSGFQFPVGFENSEFKEDLKTVWSDDFIRRSGVKEKFEQVKNEISKILKEINVLKINSDSTGDSLLVYPKDEKKVYIVVGGNRLSRGLTLEGLCTSFFVRNTKTSDTLMQMGRWFGYRKGYAEITRIYVEKDMEIKFSELAFDEFEYRQFLKQYAESNFEITPEKLFPKIRVRASMQLVARNKMGAAKQLLSNFSGMNFTTQIFDDEKYQPISNIAVTSGWLKTIEKEGKKAENRAVIGWSDISSEQVADFLDKFSFSPFAPILHKGFGKNFSRVLRSKEAKRDLGRWDIVVVAGSVKRRIFKLGPLKVAGTTRGTRGKKLVNTIQSLKSSAGDNELKNWEEIRAVNRPILMIYPIQIDRGPGTRSGYEVIGLRFAIPGEISKEKKSYLGQV